jgi:hypothetical protein
MAVKSAYRDFDPREEYPYASSHLPVSPWVNSQERVAAWGKQVWQGANRLNDRFDRWGLRVFFKTTPERLDAMREARQILVRLDRERDPKRQAALRRQGRAALARAGYGDGE